MASTSSTNEADLPSAEFLHRAIIDRDLVMIDRILKESDGWKASDDDGETVLHLAFKYKEGIINQQEKIIQILDSFLDEGLSVNVKNAVGQTVLFSAIEDRLKLVVDFLAKHGADLNVRDQNGNSLVHFLIEDQFNKYSEYCSRNNTYDERQLFEHEDINFMIWLLSKGINVDCKNKDGKTALHVAIECNLQHVMPIVIKYMNDLQHLDEEGRTIIEVFFKTKTSMNIRQAPVPTYIYNSYYGSRYDIDIVKFLLNKGVSVDHVDKKGNTLVHTFLKSYDRNPEIIRWMLQRYTKINARDKDGNTALHLVIENSITVLGQHKKNTIDFVRVLLSKGANVHLKNQFGDTTVRQAVRVKHAEVLKALQAYGADLSPNGGDLLLHDVGIRYYPSIDDKVYAPMVDMLVRAGWDVNEVRPGDGYTPLMEACRFSCPAVARKLIENGANVHYAEEKNGMRPMHMAVGLRMDEDSNEAALFKLLVKSGADVNVKNTRGETVLHLAARHDYFTVKTLLDLGADVDASDNDGRLPLYEAIREQNLEGMRALWEFGADVNDEGVLREIEALDEIKYNVEDTVDHLAEQWVKFKAADLHVVDGFAVYAGKESHHQLYSKCLEEVETLKTYYLDDRTTLYNLLHMDVRFKCVFMANNERLRKLVESSSLQSDFPNYYVFVLARYNQAIARYPLIEPAKRAWYYLTDVHLPDICVTRILAHVKNEDLKVMAEEEEEINTLKRPSQLSIDEAAKKQRLT